MTKKWSLIPLIFSAACGAAEPRVVEVPTRPDVCSVPDPGPYPALDWVAVDGGYLLSGSEAGVLYVWTRDVDRLREALATCPAVVLVPVTPTGSGTSP